MPLPSPVDLIYELPGKTDEENCRLYLRGNGCFEIDRYSGGDCGGVSTTLRGTYERVGALVTLRAGEIVTIQDDATAYYAPKKGFQDIVRTRREIVLLRVPLGAFSEPPPKVDIRLTNVRKEPKEAFLAPFLSFLAGAPVAGEREPLGRRH